MTFKVIARDNIKMRKKKNKLHENVSEFKNMESQILTQKQEIPDNKVRKCFLSFSLKIVIMPATFYKAKKIRIYKKNNYVSCSV
jgi:hypothetical protein